MKVIVGLGNPGREYANTRHNVGWWIIDHLADVWRFDGWKKDGNSYVSAGIMQGARVRLIKPLTFMNLSGEVLRPYLRRVFWSAGSDLLVVVDEVQIAVGRYRFRAKGSAGGHNGLRSVEQALGTQEYARLRVGVGPDDEHRNVEVLRDYVLGDFGKRETTAVRGLLPELTEAIELWMSKGITVTMNRYAGKPAEPPTL